LNADSTVVASGGLHSAQGPIDQVLTSQAVSRAFGMDLTVRRFGHRYLATANLGF